VTAEACASSVIAGLDIGGTATRIVIWRDGVCLAARSVPTACFDDGSPDDRADRLAGMITGLLPEGAVLAAAGIGASGPMDIARGIIQNPHTLPALSGFPIAGALAARLACPVVIENDAVVAALAEHRLGAGRGSRRMVMVTLGTGIGVALLLDGMPFRTAEGTHPEAGHLPITGGTVRCYCGITGCWEQHASRAALQARLRPLLPQGTPPDRLVADAAGAAASDPALRAAFEEYGRLLGRGLCALDTLYGAEVIVLGGSAAAFFALYADGIRMEFGRGASHAVIRAASMGESGAIGAALAALGLPLL
jgi:glucokinase